jgi:hypothetical protein
MCKRELMETPDHLDFGTAQMKKLTKKSRAPGAMNGVGFHAGSRMKGDGFFTTVTTGAGGRGALGLVEALGASDTHRNGNRWSCGPRVPQRKAEDEQQQTNNSDGDALHESVGKMKLESIPWGKNDTGA